MPKIEIQDISALEDVQPAYAAAAQDDFIVPPPGEQEMLLHVKNGDAAAHSVTIDDVQSSAPKGASQFDPDVVVNVPAGGEVMINLAQMGRFIDDNGEIHLSYSVITGMTVAVFRLR